MVSIRLSRVGKRNHPTFRIVVSDKRKDTIGTSIEIIGTYDPHAVPTKIEVDDVRAKYWLSVGAKPSATVHNLFVEKGLLGGPKKVIVKAPAAAESEKASEAATATGSEEKSSEPPKTS